MGLFLIVGLTLSTVLIAQNSRQSQTEGHVSGTVINDDGNAIPFARICTTIKKTNSSSNTCGPQADEHGNFDFAVPLATNGISAEEPEAGYRVGSEVPVTLTLTEPTVHVVIKLGARPAKVRVNVSDRNTGKPIKACRVTWIALDDVHSSETNAGNLVFVPPDTDVVLVITAPGYKRWLYSEGNPSEPLRFHAAEERDINAELTPDTR